ncbi:MAG: metallophosphoesterase family protein, partial [Lentisphaeraceae bacterium]|nr:metallophosphoesterase family protein [Lentisphaeraceae bacterium]
MRYGVVSDIHANIQAWKAVLRDMKSQGVDVILCLGDVVGYGPNPAEVLDSCYEHVDYFILGNHDAVVGNRLDSSLFNDNAKYLIDWTKDQLNSSASDFFSDMPLRMEGDGFVCAHGELAMPGRFGYIYEAQDAIASFTSNQSPMMFVGHTHFPAKFVLDTDNNSVRKDSPTDSFLLPNERYLINAGSVGDPRDGNITASYCIYDTDSSMIKFRQVPFDIDQFRLNLKNVKLPVNPFFIRVYDGLQSETETIKDMKVMESNQTTEATGNSQRVIRVGEDVKTRRKKLNFSMDDVRSTRHLKVQEATRREAETQAKKKGKAVVFILIAALMVVFVIVIAVVKSNQKVDNTANRIVNEAPDSIKNQVDTINQIDGKDLVLTGEKAELPVDAVFDETSGLITGWTKQTTQVKWNVRVKNKGWYELLVEHAKSDTESEVRLKMGFKNFDVTLPSTEEGKLEEKSLGYFQTETTGDMGIYLIALKAGPEKVTDLKSVKLRFHGDKKPNPYGDLADVLFDDFTSPHFDKEWVIKGDAFPHRPLSRDNISPFIPVKGVSGDYCAGSINNLFETKESLLQAEGTMVSKKFIIKHRYIHMLARGDRDKTTISVSIKGDDVKTIKPPHSWPIQLVPVSFKVTDYLGQEAQLVFRDLGDRNLVFDNIVFSNKEVADFPSSSNELKREEPVIVENKGNEKLAKAGKAFIKGDIDATINTLSSSGETPNPEVVDSSIYGNEILRFSDLKMASNKKLEQLESGNVSVSSCNDKDTITLKGGFTKTQDLLFLQLDAITTNEKPVGLAGNGNFFLSGISFNVNRSELMNKGRFVRVSLSGPSTLSLAEVEVFSGGKNIATGKAATQSTQFEHAEAKLAVDGNKDGGFGSGSVTHTVVGDKDAWWEVDLGQTEAIDQLKVYNRTDGDLLSRLNRYSITILDENRKIVWQDFVKEAKDVNEHTVGESFGVNFDFAKATYTGNDRKPSYCIHSNSADKGWSVYSKQKENQSAWFGLKNPLIINEKDSFTAQLNFNSKNKKHVFRKFRLTALSDKSDISEEEKKRFRAFLNFEDAILDTFVEDTGKKVDLIGKATGKVHKGVPILGVKDGRIYYTKSKYLEFDALSDQELEKRAKRLENGEVVWAYYKGELAEKANDLSYDKESFIGSLVEAGSKEFVAKYNPKILTGRYIEIWRQNNEGNPEFN